jgi:hypothetical protein
MLSPYNRIVRKCTIPAMATSPRKLKFGLINSKKQQPGPLAIPLKTAIYKGTGGQFVGAWEPFTLKKSPH